MPYQFTDEPLLTAMTNSQQ